MRGIALTVSSVMLMNAAAADPSLASNIKHVIVIVMENHDANAMYKDSPNTRYIHSLYSNFAHAANFEDELPKLHVSEPHYIWMEAGTNSLPDHTFTRDAEPRARNSTRSREHLVAQIEASGTATWAAYQEGLSSKSPDCPIVTFGLYAARHNPFVFFQDVAGDPPSRHNADCAKHFKAYDDLASDIKTNTLASYVFITPNVCHDMHGDRRGCPNGDPANIIAGDQWLAKELPPLIDWVNANSGVIFLTWDEYETGLLPKTAFFAIGPGVKPHYEGTVKYDHGSIIKTVEEILDVPILPAVAEKNDLSDLFIAGKFP
jgi:phosphatidylinositol-3-phosphatase